MTQSQGSERAVLETLFAEVGWELETFPNAAHLASWVGICLGQHESADKRMSGRMCKGNHYAKTILVQVAHATGKIKKYLGHSIGVSRKDESSNEQQLQ